MDKYYYFAAQLPTLFFKQKDFMSEEYFLEEAKKWLGKKDITIIVNVKLSQFKIKNEKLSFLKKWLNFENELRSEIVEYRKSRLQNHQFNSKIFSTSLLNDKSPLEIEKFFLKLRWEYIEDMKVEHYSDLQFLILYFLQLQILTRLSSFDEEIGKDNFSELITLEEDENENINANEN